MIGKDPDVLATTILSDHGGIPADRLCRQMGTDPFHREALTYSIGRCPSLTLLSRLVCLSWLMRRRAC